MRFVFKFLVIPAILLPVFFFLVNSFDRKLNPEIEQFVSAARREVPPAENAYFALLGHNSAAGLDPHAEGVSFVGRLEEKFGADRKAAIKSREEMFGPPALAVNGGGDLLDATCAGNCLDLYRARAGEIGALLRDNRELIERYRGLYRYRRFAETTLFPFSAEAVATVRKTQKVLLLGVALQSAEEGVDAALAAVEEDVRFWRTVLAGTRRLVNKMTAVAALHRDIRLLAQIVAEFEIDEGQAARISAAAASLTPEERALSPAMRAECAHVLEGVTGFLKDSKALTARLFKEKATKNLLFERFRLEIEIYDLPAPEWLRRWEHLRAAKKKEKGGVLYPLKLFYNPVGEIMADTMHPDFSVFPLKVHNLDGYLALLRAQLEMRRRQVAPDDIPAFLEGSCPDHCDPYTRRPFTWNAEEGSISFTDPVAKKPRRLTLR